MAKSKTKNTNPTQEKKKLSICITTGGTGGHVMPAIGLIQHLQTNESYIKCALSIDSRGEKIIPYEVIDKEKLIVRISNSYSRFILIRIFKSIFHIFPCLFFIRKYDVVVSFGTYNSIPYLVAAWLLRKKIILHEQNLIFSRTNNLFAFASKHMALTFPIANGKYVHKHVLTGLILRKSLYKSKNPGKRKNDKFTIMITFGSLGGKSLIPWIETLVNTIDKKTLANISLLIDEAIVPESLMVGTEKSKGTKKPIINIKTYAKNFNGSFLKHCEESDLIITRGGAVSLYEILFFRKKCLILPWAHSINNHQLLNGEFIESINMGKVIKDPDNQLSLAVEYINQQYNSFMNETDDHSYLSNPLEQKKIYGHEAELMMNLINS